MMGLTVRKLIAELKKMPPNARVCFAAHDQDDDAGEYDGGVFYVSEASEAMREQGYGVVLR